MKEMIQKIFYNQKIVKIEFTYDTEHNGKRYRVLVDPPKSRKYHVYHVCIKESEQTYTKPTYYGTTVK